MEIDTILDEILLIVHDFRHIVEDANEDFINSPPKDCSKIALDLFEHKASQTRILATFMLDKLPVKDEKALRYLRERVSNDDNWRVQKMLAKTFDEVCKGKGNEKALPLITNLLL